MSELRAWRVLGTNTSYEYIVVAETAAEAAVIAERSREVTVVSVEMLRSRGVMSRPCEVVARKWSGEAAEPQAVGV